VYCPSRPASPRPPLGTLCLPDKLRLSDPSHIPVAPLNTYTFLKVESRSSLEVLFSDFVEASRRGVVGCARPRVKSISPWQDRVEFARGGCDCVFSPASVYSALFSAEATSFSDPAGRIASRRDLGASMGYAPAHAAILRLSAFHTPPLIQPCP
jgi:hypothetical protein